MLKLQVIVEENFNEETNEFLDVVEILELEHSLASLSKWESKWQKPFLSKEEKTQEEFVDYIRCMMVDPDSSGHLLELLSSKNYEQIAEHLQNKQTATWFSEEQKKPSNSVVTAEVLYYQMFSLNIDISAEHWHLNKLLTLLEVFGRMNAKPEKKSKAEIAERQWKMNEERRKRMQTSG